MRLFQMMMAAALAVLIGIAPAAAQTFPKFTGLVVDAANVLPPATKADLEVKLEALQKDTKRQLVIATIPDLQGYDIAEYGVGLGRAWDVGLKGVNNGAILFIAPNEAAGHRGPRLEVGYGLEPILTDAFSGTMIRAEMLPKLKAQPSDIPGALEAGTDAIIKQLRASPEEAKANVDAAAAAFDKVHQRGRSSEGGLPFGFVIIAFVIGFIVLSALRRGRSGQSYRSGVAPVVLWGPGFGGGWGGGGGSGGGWGGGSGGGGGSDGSWGGGGFTGGGGGDFGGGGASGDW